MEGRLLLDVVVRESAAVLKLLASEDEALLIGRDAFLVLDLGLDVVDGVRRLDLKDDHLFILFFGPKRFLIPMVTVNPFLGLGRKTGRWSSDCLP